MKKIEVVHVSEKGKALLEELQARKKARIKELQERLPPPEMMKKIKEKADEIDKHNDGTLDKSTFMLGMVVMWRMLNNK